MANNEVVKKMDDGEKSLVVKGNAPIKKEYILKTDAERVINWDHMPDDVKEKLKSINHSSSKPDKSKGDSEVEKTGNAADTDVDGKRKIDDRDANPHKKFKLRGQNKNKLRYQVGKQARWNKKGRGGPQDRNEERAQQDGEQIVRVDKAARLCLKLMENDGNCPYKTGCNYCHDLYSVYQATESDKFDEAKPCYLYTTYGRCAYGVACRFCKSHLYIDEEKQIAFNLINHEQWSFNGGRDAFKNRMSNKLEVSLQQDLRKKRFNFELVDQALKCLYKADLDQDDKKDDDIIESDSKQNEEKRIGAPLIDEFVKGRDAVRRKVDFCNKLYLAPLTTVGNLPFRRLCKKFQCDITCAEMSLSSSLLNGTPSEWSHMKRHESEDVFGIQITGTHPERTTKVVKVLNETCELDFIDINCGCPTEFIYQSGAGAGLMARPSKLRKIIAGACMVSRVPITIKMRTGCSEEKNTAHTLINSIIKPFGNKYIGAITVHGRSRNQRYLKMANWDYVDQCAKFSGNIPVLGSGDCISLEDYYEKLEKYKNLSGVVIARGALMKPWIFTEIKERRTMDVPSNERLSYIGEYVKYALDHWGSDATGVENSRRFLLEWLSFSSRYIPAGLLEVLPQKINDRPPAFKGRDELETLLASQSCSDWIKISEMFLGKVPDSFKFLPKHKANAYESIVEG